MKPELIVSIHDVTQHNADCVAVMLKELASAGVLRCSLLVVPNHHRRGPISANALFCSWLREAQEVGHEIVAHGFYHLREARSRETAAEKFVTRVYTRGEGEFFDLNEAEAAERLELVRSEFASAGFSPRGFIAPAWLLSEAAERVLCRRGYDYTTRIHGITDLARRRTTRARSLVYSTSTRLRRLCSLGWNALLFTRQRRQPLIRIGVHPPDHEHPPIWSQVMKLVRSLAITHNPVTYIDWVIRNRGVA